MSISPTLGVVIIIIVILFFILLYVNKHRLGTLLVDNVIDITSLHHEDSLVEYFLLCYDKLTWHKTQPGTYTHVCVEMKVAYTVVVNKHNNTDIKVYLSILDNLNVYSIGIKYNILVPEIIAFFNELDGVEE